MTKIMDPIGLLIISSVHLCLPLFVPEYNGSGLNISIVICIGIIMVKMGVTMLMITMNKNKGGKS